MQQKQHYKLERNIGKFEQILYIKYLYYRLKNSIKNENESKHEVHLPQGQNHFEETVRYILEISLLVFQNLLAKTEYAKHVVRNITFSEAAGQDNNITGQTASEQVLFYLNVQLFATIVSIHGIWEVGDWGVYSPHQYSTFRNGMIWNLVPGTSLEQ